MRLDTARMARSQTGYLSGLMLASDRMKERLQGAFRSEL